MALLEVRNLTIKFGGVTAVDNVTFAVDECRVLGIIGPNGSGKTTLFNLLSGIYKPTAGEIFLRGASIGALAPDEIFNRGIARTFQNGRLFWKLSVLENIMIALPEVRATSVLSALVGGKAKRAAEQQAIAKAMEIMGVFGDLLTPQADKLAQDLPYADRRRLEICRAIASRPQVILLDEPSAGMDSVETMKLMHDLLKVKEVLPRVTLIVVEHDMNFIRGLVDRVMVLNYGKKIADGSFDEVAANPQVINAYLGQEE